ncbi:MULTISPECIES: cell wall metabolism sensor histidine kinase WalK [Acidobacteriaceae]|uniref:sensor histidine kinase n=1 Tax=Acidobacteriaceae TaxID=204434 RepID=UPI00131D25A6|nr:MULTISPECIES: ATP-binding protein [Acidobacteriaceae]MDW5266160.1 ATP-binding protein [Edaphobacter sp.]
MKRQASISLRLTTWFGSVFLIGWILFGAAMWLNLKQTLTQERKLTLTHRIDRLQYLLRKDQQANDAARNQDFEDFARATGKGLSEIFAADGLRAYGAPSQAAQDFPWPTVRGDSSERFVLVNAGDQPYLVLMRPFSLGGKDLFLLAAAPEAGSLLILERFWRGLLAAAPILLLISSASGYWVSRKALQPVDKITATARSISIRNLSERLPVAETGDELQRLAETCNAMLARLDTAVGQIRQFTADASHELRGPLSFTRTVAEVALRNPHIDSGSRRAFEDIVDEAAKAAVLLEEMLTLARVDAGSFHIILEPMDLTRVVEEACGLARPLADERNLLLSIARDSAQSVGVLGDFTSLRRLLWILLDNALKYTEAPGRIEVALNAVAGQAVLSIHNSGMGIAATDLPRIFDRFYRVDPSRSQVEGNGLGLAIAKWISEMHFAELSVVSAEQSGTTFQLMLPLHVL